MDSLKRLLSAAFVLASLGFPQAATAAPGERAAVDTERSEDLFKRGTRAFEEQKYSEAYAALRSAWDLAPNYRTAAGLGQVELHLGQHRDAAEHLSYCLRHYPADADARVRTHVEQGLEQAREHVAALRVRVNVEGADVAVDGNVAGKSPLEGLLFVEPGAHEVTASHDGRVARAAVDGHVRATEEVALTVPLESTAPPFVAPPVAPPPGVEMHDEPVASHGLPPSSWVLIVGGGLTAVALGTSIGFHVKGGSAEDDANGFRRTIGSAGGSGCFSPSSAAVSSACARLDDKNEERNDANKVSLGAAIGTGVFAAATVATFFVLRSSERSHGSTARPLSLGFRAAQGGGVLSLHGGF